MPDFRDKDAVLTDPARVLARREHLRRSQQDVADEAGVDRGTVEYMEGKLKKGRRVQNGWASVRAVAASLGVRPETLLHATSPLPAGIDREAFFKQVRESPLTEAFEVLREVEVEISPRKARTRLEKLIELLRPQVFPEAIDGLARIYARALTRLAEIEVKHDKRLSYRLEAVKALGQLCAENPSSLDVVSWVEMIVNFHFDCGRAGGPKLQRQVTRAFEAIDAELELLELEGQDNPATRVLLLAQKNSLARCRWPVVRNSERKSHVDKMVRTGQLCLKLAPNNSIALIASAYAYWTRGLLPENFSSEADLESAQKILAKAAETSSLGLLVLARFCRLTYQPRQAIEAFRRFESIERNRRLVLSEARIVGEAARQLWLIERTGATDEVEYARNIAAEAVEAGYGDARSVCALAFLESIFHGADSGSSVLRRLQIVGVGDDVRSLEDILKAAVGYAERSDVEGLRTAFAFGFESGIAWNSLGTFSLDVLNNVSLAIALYEAGLALSPNEPVLWLNKARALRVLGREDEVPYALQNARKDAPRNFLRFIDEFERGEASPIG